MGLKKRFIRHINVYRIIVAAAFIVSVILVMAIPAQMSGASPWAYYYGVKNFSQGKFTINNQLLFLEANEAREKGGILMQYVNIGFNKWALEKAPGYVFYLVPFEWLGITLWGNVLLALGMVVVTYILLRQLRDEKTACVGSLLLLFTPTGLIMFNRAYMDTFASLAFLATGGGLYWYFLLEREKWRPLSGSIILFLAFFLISWSVATRYSNLPVAVIIVLHFIIVRLVSLKIGDKRRICREICSVILGIGLPLAVLLLYNNYVFGSPWDYGYRHTVFPVKFAYEYFGQVSPAGEPIPLKIILDNLKTVPLALLQGFPLLVVFAPGIIVVFYQKLSRRQNPLSESQARLIDRLPWGTLLVLVGWFLSVYLLYMTYEFTAEFLASGSSFFRYTRYYLPGLFPVVIICSLIISRLPVKIGVPVISLIIAAGIGFYFQVALNPNA